MHVELCLYTLFPHPHPSPLPFPPPGSYMYTITERKMVNGEKVESVRPLSDKEYEVHHKLVLVFMLVCIVIS